MDKEYLDAVNNNKTLLSNRQYLTIIGLLSGVIMLIPIIFFSEESIRGSEYILYVLNLDIFYFNNIETYATAALNNNQYYEIKLQNLFSIFCSIIIFFVTLNIFSKIYLNSLGYLNLSNPMYNNAIIKQNKTNADIFTYLLQGFFAFFIIDMFVAGNFIEVSFDSDIRTDRWRISAVGSYIFSCLISCFMGMMSGYLIIEFLAHVRKAFRR